MTYYRLLRDNKESGPFSEEEMIARGFKPYDLLWIEGKSAGWRYPSEISAFKAYAPAVEEQPYDRFFKRQPQQAASGAPQPKNSAVSPGPAAETRPETRPTPPAQKPVNTSTGRHIYVTLPSGRSVNLSTLADKESDTKKTAETRQATMPETPVIKYIPATLTDYNDHEQWQPGDKMSNGFAEAKQATVITTSAPAATAITPSGVSRNVVSFRGLFNLETNWGLVGACAVGVATMVVLGIMIGLGISRDRRDTEFTKRITAKTSQASSPSTKPSVPTSDPRVAENLVVSPVESTTPNQETAKKAESTSPSKNKNINQKAANSPSQQPNPAANVGGLFSAKDGPATAQAVPSPMIPKQPATAIDATEVEKKLSLQANDFKTGAFGGISGLKYTLVNGSKTTVESVEVEVNYITANNKIYKTEKLLFHDIAPGAQATVDAPSSSRGIRIQGRITRVTPKDNSVSINR